MIHYTSNRAYTWATRRREWKYRLRTPYTHDTGIIGYAGGDAWVRIHDDGRLQIAEGYAWDGASGPAIDTASFMRGSLVHDALYQLIRRRVLPPAARKPADGLLVSVALADGMWYVRSLWVYAAVRVFGGFAL